MFTFTITRFNGKLGKLTRERHNLTQAEADSFYFEAIGKASKVIDQHDTIDTTGNIAREKMIRCARLESGKDTIYQVSVHRVSAIA